MPKGIVVRAVARADRSVVEGLGRYGAATLHEAQGRTGLLDPRLRPVYRCPRIAGTAVTVSVPPGDNWMVHVAIEQCQDGDVLVVAPTSPSDAGYIGELIATALQTRGVRGVIIDAGCRDTTELAEMGFPVWSRWICATGTVKRTLGDVNVPIVCAGQQVDPGDVVIADNDGVVVVPRRRATAVLEAARGREETEARARARYRAGELSLDVNRMREALVDAGLTYVDDLPEE